MKAVAKLVVVGLGVAVVLIALLLGNTIILEKKVSRLTVANLGLQTTNLDLRAREVECQKQSDDRYIKEMEFEIILGRVLMHIGGVDVTLGDGTVVKAQQYEGGGKMISVTFPSGHTTFRIFDTDVFQLSVGEGIPRPLPPKTD